MMLKMWNQQVKSRFSHNTLQGHFLREGIRLRWLDLKRPPSCDQTAIAEKKRDSTCLWRCANASLENLIVVIVGLEPTPTRPNLSPLPVKQIPYSNICNHL